MPRSLIVVFVLAVSALLAFWLLLQTPGSLNYALAHPWTAIAGTSRGLNSMLVEASESADPVRAAGERLLQPLGILRLVKIYSPTDSEPTKPKKR